MIWEKILPEWKAPGAEPPDDLKEGGFKAGYKPPAAYFNWLFYTTYEALKEMRNNIKKDEWDGKIDSDGGDTTDAKVSEFTSSDDSFPIPKAGETHGVIMGKMKKFFEDIRNTATGACFIGNIVNNCTSTMANLPLSAAQGKVLMDLYTQLNSNLGNCFKYNGEFAGDFNRIDIPHGVYRITVADVYMNGPVENFNYCCFIQLPAETYYTQVIIDADRIYCRKRIGNPATWIRWYKFPGSLLA